MSSTLAMAPGEPSIATLGPISLGLINTFARLPDRFYVRQRPQPVLAPKLVKLNTTLAEQFGLDPQLLSSPQGAAVLAGNEAAADSEPLAQAYAGHQFGHFVPQLGDGRATLLGEVRAQNGTLYDLQLKGAGRTAFSRGGDGRAAIGPVLREYLLSEAMAALGVPTTRSLAAVATGEQVLRDRPLPGAVLTRVAASHLRVGTFQFFAARGDTDALGTLAAFAIARHYPEAADANKPVQAFLGGVISRQAALVAQWMHLGFVHGVMNTDNTSISGETIDYGPCAFLEAYDPETAFSSIDIHGRYAYGNQPPVMLWNLTRLAETLLPLLALEEGSEDGAVASATEVLETFLPQYEAAYAAGLGKKLGLETPREHDRSLFSDLLRRMAVNEVDFTSFFRLLSQAAASPEGDRHVRSLFADPSSFDVWARAWRDRLAEEPTFHQARAEAMQRTNPLFIPRNHLVEEALAAATFHGDYRPFEDLLEVISHPFVHQTGKERYAEPAKESERVLHTFCGT